MTTGCETIRPQLGAFVDGELPDSRGERVQQHLTACEACRKELSHLESLARHLAGGTPATAPAELWSAIEHRLDQAVASAPRRKLHPPNRPWLMRMARKPLAAAAVLLLVVGLGWLATNAPWETPAMAAQIDFRPLLEQADGDIAAGIRALMQAYGGEKISSDDAPRRIKVRIHAADQLPGDLRLESRYVLNMGAHHQALAFHYTTPSGGHLLLLQCPPNVEKNYGNYECVACSVGDHHGQGVQVGKLHLMHMMSDNVCVCVVSTLDESDLEGALKAVKITF